MGCFDEGKETLNVTCDVLSCPHRCRWRAPATRYALSAVRDRSFSGNVIGALIVSGPIIIIVASFTNVAYEQLPLDDDDVPSPSSARGNGSGGQIPDPSVGIIPSRPNGDQRDVDTDHGGDEYGHDGDVGGEDLVANDNSGDPGGRKVWPDVSGC